MLLAKFTSCIALRGDGYITEQAKIAYPGIFLEWLNGGCMVLRGALAKSSPS